MTRSETRSSTPSPFATRLREAQRDAGMKNEECAREIGVTLRTWQHWRSGSTEPRHTGQRAAVARLLGKPLAWFFEEAA